MEHEIQSITFGIMSEKDVLDNSACLVESSKRSGPGSVYDPRMGPLTTTDPCEACFEKVLKCPGHFGHIKLHEPIFHPLFVTKLPGLLRQVCSKCKSEVKATVCKNCGEKQPAYKITSDELTCDGARVTPAEFLQSHPCFERFVMRNVPVLPHCSRPSIQINDVVGDDDLTTHYIEIVKLNNNISSAAKKDRLLKTLFTRVGALMNNSKGKVKHATNLRPLKGIKERLCGKSGLVRGNIMGKRVNHSGRTVIGSNPLLALDELEVPRKMARVLTFPEKCTRFNIERLTHYLTSGQVTKIEKPGGRTIHVDGLRQCRKVRAYPATSSGETGKSTLCETTISRR